jgi:micrococcal nuclease
LKSFSTFWHRDLVNKLITLTSLGLTLASVGLVIVVATMPAGKSLSGAVAEMLPRIRAGAGGVPSTLTSTPSPKPTWMPHATRTPTGIAGLPPTPQQLAPVPTAPVNTAPPPMPAASSVPSLAPTPETGAECIPANASQTGRVVEIVDPNTIKVLIDDKVYVVRYLGVSAPSTDNPFYQAAVSANSRLVFGKDLALISEGEDKDAAGRLLRYVIDGSVFVNLELIKEGLATAATAGTDLACGPAFDAVQEAARRDATGLWSVPGQTATP